MEDYFEANRRHWNELARIHFHSNDGLYNADSVLRGETRLDPFTDSELGEVCCKSLLHLQCHFGLDSLRLANRGARVTGVDFSGDAIDFARTLARKIGADAQFVEANIYDAPRLLDQLFDIVFVSWGALCWLPDIPRWAAIVAGFLKHGGFLYLLESHPVLFTFIQDDQGVLRPHYDYFGTQPVPEDTEQSYSGAPDKIENTRSYAWDHPISEVVNALLSAGLELDFLNEHDRIPWRHFEIMERSEDGLYALPPGLPLAYSLKAVKV